MGGDTVIQQPAAPAAPSVSSSISDYVNSYPQLMALEQQYGPQLAQQQFQLSQQYAPQYASLLKQTNEAAYPETTALQENLAKQASEGMNASVPDSMKQQYLDQLRAESSPGSGISADYVSRGLINQQQEYNNYYRDLALSVTGKMPLTQAQNPNFKQTNSLLSPESVLGYNQNTYGSYANLYGNMYNSNANMANSNTQGMYGLIGSGMSAAAIGFCWIAAEVFDEDIVIGERVNAARKFILTQMPMWFINGYKKYGERIASFIHNKPILKNIIRPLFSFFAKKGGYNG